MADDRIRAKEPKKREDRWSKGQIEAVLHENGRYEVAVNSGSDQHELSVSKAIYDLFTGRLDIEDGEEPVGETVYFIEKGG